MPATEPIPSATPAAAETFEVQQLKAMEQPKWNEGRLDDLSKRVDDGIGRLDEDRKELRGEMKEGFDKVDKRFDKVDKRFDKVDKRFERVDERFDKVDEEFKAVRQEMSAGFDRLFWKLVSTGVSVAVAAFGLAELL
jgi:archaellum component FlaC